LGIPAPSRHVPPPTTTQALSAREAELLGRLREGDEEAFEALVGEHYRAMLNLALGFVRTRAIAEEVVQEAWLGVLKGIDRFEGRSSLRTWILRIVANIAKTKGVREARSVPFASLASDDESGAAVDPDRFRGPTDGFPGHWWAYPSDWRALPETALHEQETLDAVRHANEDLPPAQRAVITMRDMVGCTPEEVCAALDVTDGNQRVLLHRARSRVRAALEVQLDG
jgi:RNA polymerase sigma-70 factor, ECF subfamily